jgi:hypothetical protein
LLKAVSEILIQQLAIRLLFVYLKCPTRQSTNELGLVIISSTRQSTNELGLAIISPTRQSTNELGLAIISPTRQVTNELDLAIISLWRNKNQVNILFFKYFTTIKTHFIRKMFLYHHSYNSVRSLSSCMVIEWKRICAGFL